MKVSPGIKQVLLIPDCRKPSSHAGSSGYRCLINTISQSGGILTT
jgi:hypothetical protein